MPTAATADELLWAIAAGQDAEAARLLCLLSAAGAGLLPATFAELAAAGLPQAAVALAQAECGQADLGEADATNDGSLYLHAAAEAGAGAAVVAALVAAGVWARRGGERGSDPSTAAPPCPHSPPPCPRTHARVLRQRRRQQ